MRTFAPGCWAINGAPPPRKVQWPRLPIKNGTSPIRPSPTRATASTTRRPCSLPFIRWIRLVSHFEQSSDFLPVPRAELALIQKMHDQALRGPLKDMVEDFVEQARSGGHLAHLGRPKKATRPRRALHEPLAQHDLQHRGH